MITSPPSSSVCCTPAPFVLEFDPAGKLVSSWGGPGQGYQWPQSPGGLTVDAQGQRLDCRRRARTGRRTAPGRGRGDAVAGEAPAAAAPRAAVRTPPGPADAHVLKFSRDGKFLLQIGAPGKMDGADSQTTLNRPSAVAVDATANEVFVADTRQPPHRRLRRGHRRLQAPLVRLRREDGRRGPGPYDRTRRRRGSSATSPASRSRKDSMVYVCDRSSNRIQVFQKDGKFVKEAIVSKNTLGAAVTGQFGVVSSHGAVWDIAFSNDAQQRYVFVADGHDKKVHRPAARHAGAGRHASAAAAAIPGSSSPSAASRSTRRATSTPASSITASACRNSCRHALGSRLR